MDKLDEKGLEAAKAERPKRLRDRARDFEEGRIPVSVGFQRYTAQLLRDCADEIETLRVAQAERAGAGVNEIAQRLRSDAAPMPDLSYIRDHATPSKRTAWKVRDAFIEAADEIDRLHALATPPSPPLDAAAVRESALREAAEIVERQANAWERHNPHAPAIPATRALAQHIRALIPAAAQSAPDGESRLVTETWLPIEAANKSGEILVYMNDSLTVAKWDEDKYAKRPRPYWRSQLGRALGVGWDRAHQPTSFLPLKALPEAPVKAAGEGEG